MENLDLLEPELLYTRELKDKHHQNVIDTFEQLIKKSGLDKDQNKATCKKYYTEAEALKKLYKKAKKLKALKVFFIFLCLLIIGIFLLIFVYKPRKKTLDEQISNQEAKVKALLDEAWSQMASLNALFEGSLPARIMHKTTPLIEMDRIFDVKKYELMREKYGLWGNEDEDSSTLDLQSGSILGNPFVVFKDLRKRMVMQKYEGSITYSYTRRVGDKTYTYTDTLRASIEKPRPDYSKETYLVYGNEAAEHLSFSREPSSINSMDEKDIEKYVRKHEKDLTKLAEKAMKKGGTYTPLGNSEFELFFGGLDRDNEVEYRLLFTPLAQKSMLQLLKSKVGFGDDFYFKKIKGLNVIQSQHSQGEALFIDVEAFKGFDIDVVEQFFIEYNDAFFKNLYFDFAPLLSIPLYQQYKSHEYIYKNNVGSNFNCFEHEVVANRFNPKRFAHPSTKTEVILKTNILQKDNESDIVNVTAHSFNTRTRIEIVTKIGKDGCMHDIPIEWIEYIPIENSSAISVSDLGLDEEAKFNTLEHSNVIYAKGLISHERDLNVDINNLKSLMNKD